MKLFVVFAAFLAVSLAAPQGNPRDAQITHYENNNIGVDGYNFAYETSDGISRQEQAELKNAGTDNEALVQRGTYSYIGNDGVKYTVSFIADEFGFRAEGAHLPRA